MQLRAHFTRFAFAAATVAAFASCGGGGGETGGATTDTATQQSQTTPPVGGATGGTVTPGPGGKTITIHMVTDQQGNNRFEPADVEAKKGDVLRYVLQSGVHNVHFVADSNKTMSNPPPASPLFQAQGESHDILVDWNPGRYYFQCDPHLLLGMIGHVTVK